MPADVKAPDVAIVERAQDKAASGEDLNQREARALEAQRQIDLDRGYERVEWKPGVFVWRHLATQDTVLDTGEDSEMEMRRKHNEWALNQAGR